MLSNKEVSANLLLLTCLFLLAGWHFRDRIRGEFMPPPKPVPATTVLYSWRDRNGTLHFSQEGADHGAHAVVVDTSHITPLEPPMAPHVASSPQGYTLASGSSLRPGVVAPSDDDNALRASIEARATNDN